MKQINRQIKEFILAFDLAHPDAGVCFEAKVFLYSNKLVLQVASEIHIITILGKKLDVLYILNQEISAKGFPDFFDPNHCLVEFWKKKGLMLAGSNTDNINYSILIQPTGKDCEPATFEEMQGKLYN